MSNLVKAIDLRCRPCNNVNLLMSFTVACVIFNFFVSYINGVSVTRYKNNLTCYKTLQKITDRVLQQIKTLDLCQKQ